MLNFPARRLSLSFLACVLSAGAAAQPMWPERPIQMIVPFPAGGGVDVIARPFAEMFGALLQQPVVVMPRDGAAGPIRMGVVAAAKDFISSAEDWVGALTSRQRALVRERLQGLTPSRCGWVDNRARFLAEMRRRVDVNYREPDYVGQLGALLAHPESRWDDTYRAGFEHNREVVVSLLAELDATLDARQRARLVTRLRGFANDFRELAARPETAG